jgi:hypothetical protein
MKSTHVLSVEGLAGLPPIRQRLSILNEGLLVSGSVKPIGAFIILTDSLASSEGLNSTGISYRTNDMLFRTRKSLQISHEISGRTWI